MVYKTKTKEEKQAQLAELADNINEQLNYFIRQPESMVAFLRFREQFYNYSYRNQLLIYKQSNDSQYVASFSAWKEKGYNINKGEKGLKIFIPVTQKEFRFGPENEDWRPVSSASEREKELIKKNVYPLRNKVKGYKVGYVFDISQTNFPKEKYPELIQSVWTRDTTLDFDRHIRGAKLYAEDRGIRVVDRQMTPGHHGSYFHRTHHIEMNSFLENEKYFKTITHELAHSQLHRFSLLATGKKELQAEVVGTLALRYYGIENIDNNLHYIQSYTKGMSEEERYPLIQQTLDMASEYIHQVDSFLMNYDKYQSMRIDRGMTDLNKYSDRYIRDLVQSGKDGKNHLFQKNKHSDLNMDRGY